MITVLSNLKCLIRQLDQNRITTTSTTTTTTLDQCQSANKHFCQRVDDDYNKTDRDENDNDVNEERNLSNDDMLIITTLNCYNKLQLLFDIQVSKIIFSLKLKSNLKIIVLHAIIYSF